MYLWCYHRVLRGDHHTVAHMHGWPNGGSLPCLIIADNVYLKPRTDNDRGDNSRLLNFANLHRWCIVGAMQSSATAYKELDLCIITTTVYRRPDDRALSGPTTRQHQQQQQ
ncbi:uncharacterized protein PpBr36_09802 [Pyricularia pennisetigena]|uniref:uncharacterized protein n=1 Tax=Pyricularia pennisetigena TaxID=1578925 RepID=UPI00114F2AD1|nr:uncharacterized protein PpBr36_09802 [Pyricularia pennisetigena]TLS22436.1 hypothetical protein PpBr36_09802 [Pyricularia pennisetigena]